MEFHKTKMFDYHKGTKITKVFASSFFFVSFVNFVAERMFWQSELTVSSNLGWT